MIALVFPLTFSWAGPRLVVTSPGLVELLFQLGKGKDVVGVAQGSEFPEAATELPVVGAYFLPSLERTLRLSPDWILLDAMNLYEPFRRALSALGKRTLTFRFPTVDALAKESRRLLGEVYGQSTAPELDQLERCVSRLPGRALSGRFLLLVWPKPPVLAGHQTFLSDLLTQLGAKNALPERITALYPQVSEEWLRRQEPEQVFYLSYTDTPTRLSGWPSAKTKERVLPARYFARASLTPFHYLAHIGIPPKLIPKECHVAP